MTKIASEREQLATTRTRDAAMVVGNGGGSVFLLESQDVHYTSYLNIV